MRKNCLDAIKKEDPEAGEKLENANYQSITEFINKYNSSIPGGDMLLPGQLNINNRPMAPRMYPPVSVSNFQMMGAPMYANPMMVPPGYPMYAPPQGMVSNHLLQMRPMVPGQPFMMNPMQMHAQRPEHS